MHFIQQLRQHLSPLVAVQFAPQLLQGQRHDVIVVSAAVLGVRGNIEPHFVHEFEILRAHPRRVRTKRVFVDLPIGLVDLDDQPRSGLGQTFPRVARELGLLVGGEFVGEAANNPARVQTLSGDYNRIKDIASRDHEQRNRFAFFFRDRDGGSEQFLFIVIEDLEASTTALPLKECSRW